MIALMAFAQQTQLLLECGQEAKARPVLSRALEAGAGGALQPFQRLLENHPDWMREQLSKDPHGLLNQSLLALLPTVAEVHASPSHESLSARELAVLQLIAQRLLQPGDQQPTVDLPAHCQDSRQPYQQQARRGATHQAVARAQELRLIG